MFMDQCALFYLPCRWGSSRATQCSGFFWDEPNGGRLFPALPHWNWWWLPPSQSNRIWWFIFNLLADLAFEWFTSLTSGQQ
jgi:hypothetical protein